MYPPIAWMFVATCSAWIASGFLATARVTRRRRNGRKLASATAKVSVLKPLSGADPGLYENLKSFFLQDQPEFELVFGVNDGQDPALGVVARLQSEFPDVPCKIAIVGASSGSALNPKVKNLLGMLPHANFDLLLISDSNVRAPAHYLRELASLHHSEGAGIVTNLFAGTGERSLGAALENVQLNGFCAAGAALPTLIGDAAVIGKSTLFSRSDLERLGGWSRLSGVLAEDFILGKMFEHGGMRVVIARTVLETPNGDLSLAGAFARHLRWSMLRWRLRPLAALLEPVDESALDVALCLLAIWARRLAVASGVAHRARLRGLGAPARL